MYIICLFNMCKEMEIDHIMISSPCFLDIRRVTHMVTVSAVIEEEKHLRKE